MKGSNFKLLSNIFRGAWLINQDHAYAQLPMVASLLKGQPISGFYSEEESAEEQKLTAIYMNSEGVITRHYGRMQEAPQGSVAIIYVKGAIMKDDFCGDPGTDSIGEQMKLADSNPNIVGAVHVHDSPGGSVSGTEKCANIAANTQKPTVGFVDDLSASASYWIISGANHIIMSGNTSEVGSIGTMISFADMRPAYEKLGVKFHDILATKSKDKNKDYFDMMNGEYDNVRKNMLDPLNEVFLSSVRKNRPDVSEEALTGKMFLPTEAIAMGLADSIGTLEDAVAKVIELAGDESGEGASALEAQTNAALALAKVEEEKSKINNKNEMFDSKLDKAVLKVSAKVKAGEEVLKEDVAPVNAELEAKGLAGYAIAKVEVVEAMEAANETLASEKSELETKLEASEKEVERLGAIAGDKHTEAQKAEGDKGANGGEAKVISETEAELNEIIAKEEQEKK